MDSRVDLVTLNSDETALFVNKTRLQVGHDSSDLEKLADRIALSLGVEATHYHCKMDGEPNWEMAATSFFRMVENNKTEVGTLENSDSTSESRLDAQIDNEIGALAKDLKSKLLRSWQRLANFEPDAMGKYFNSAIVTAGGLLSMYGALEGNPLLSEYLTEIVATTAGAGAMSTYGAGVGAAAMANRELIQKFPWYQEATNNRLLKRLGKMMENEGVETPDALTPKQKAQFFESVKLNYENATPELLTSFIDLKKHELQQSAPVNTEQSESDLQQHNQRSPGIG